ncbi:MAG: isoprenylcysteine carboxylmethyltransferase family protein [Chloroflexi bacterium]|nr:isoprenylcysteine carboxylmethyltransferase family protein [Chloroflexota bacterium]
MKQRSVGQSSWSVDEDAVKREGRWSLLLRPISFLFMLALFALYFIEPLGSEWLHVSLPWKLRLLGGFLSLGGTLMLVLTHRALSIHWSTTLQFKEGHSLITTGPYGLIRHPMYTSLYIIFIGLAIVSSFWPLWILILLMTIFFFRIASIEEDMMIDKFGDEYVSYIKRSGRFLPRLRRRNY